MKIVFFGSSMAGFDCLSGLVKENLEIALVVTQPTRQRGRHLLSRPSAIEELAKNNGLKIFKPENINSNDSFDVLKDINADLFVVICYGQILSPDILALPKKMALNLHTSLLPKYRGAAPINWALINGESVTGVSVIKMTKEMDAGPVIASEKVNIESQDNAVSLSEKLVILGVKLLVGVISNIKNNNFSLHQQDESQVSYARKLKKEDGLIDWSMSAAMINNKIRGCLGWPGCYTIYRGKTLKIISAAIEAANTIEPGRVLRATKAGLLIQCGKDALLAKELQLESGKKLLAEQFLAGHKINPLEMLGKTA